MKAENLMMLLRRLAASSAKEPTPEAIDALVESITFNKLTHAEIMRGYHGSRDGSPWFPKPSEFLARARPPADKAEVGGEAEAIFQSLIERPTLYGSRGHDGTVYERRRVETLHGPAAGIAFAAVASRFQGLLLESVPFVRREFVAAYESARADHGPPLTLDPARLLPCRSAGPATLPGATDSESSEGPNQRRLREMLRGGFKAASPRSPVDLPSRLDHLRRQAEENARESDRACEEGPTDDRAA